MPISLINTVIKYLIIGIFGFLISNKVSNLPLLSWLDVDKRNISNLEKKVEDINLEFAFCEVSNEKLKFNLDKQNDAVETIKMESIKKEKQLKDSHIDYVVELNDLIKELKEAKDPSFSCQEAVEQIIRVN